MKKEVAIVIPVYKSQIDRFEHTSFIQCLKVLGSYPICLITYEELDISYYTDLLQKYDCQYETMFLDKGCFNGLAAYNRLLLSKGFYELFRDYEYILICQLDVYVFRDELQFWCDKGYDYIGAPWFKDFGNDHTKSSLKAVGNGGFSLRKVSSFLSTFDFIERNNPNISISNFWNKHLMARYYGYSFRFILSRYFGKSNNVRYYLSSTIQEDAFWSQIIPEVIKTFKIAPIKDAVGFAFETDPTYLFELNNKQLPFGCHAWHKNQFETFWSRYIKLENEAE